MTDDLNTSNDDNGVLPDETPGSPPVSDDNPLTPPTDLPTGGTGLDDTPPATDAYSQPSEAEDEEGSGTAGEAAEPNSNDDAGQGYAPTPEDNPQDTPEDTSNNNSI